MIYIINEAQGVICMDIIKTIISYLSISVGLSAMVQLFAINRLKLPKENPIVFFVTLLILIISSLFSVFVLNVYISKLNIHNQ